MTTDRVPRTADWDDFLDRLVAWAEGNDGVRALIVESRAREDRCDYPEGINSHASRLVEELSG